MPVCGKESSGDHSDRTSIAPVDLPTTRDTSSMCFQCDRVTKTAQETITKLMFKRRRPGEYSTLEVEVWDKHRHFQVGAGA